MKRCIYLLAVLLFSLQVSAQSGGVGIGTSTPHQSAALEIKSSSRGLLLPSLSTNEKLEINSPATGLLVFDNTSGSFSFYNGYNWQLLETIGRTWNRATSTICYTTGNVGIGTCVPKDLLHLNSDTSDVRLRFTVPTATYIVGIDETEGSFYIGDDSSGTLTKLLVLKRPGYLGIGTDEPQSTLHLHADSGSTAITFTNGSTTVQYIVGIDETEGSFYVGRDSAGTLDKIMVMDSAGNVGIGVTDPDAKLNIEGKIKAQEIEVNDGNGNSFTLSAGTNGMAPWEHDIIGLYKTGAFSYTSTTYVDMTWNTEQFNHDAATYLWSSGNAYVQVNDTGYYQVSYSVSGSSTSKRSTHVQLMKLANAVTSMIPGSRCFDYADNNSNGNMTAGKTLLVKLNAGDKIKVQMASGDGNVITGEVDGCSFSILKIK